MQVLTPGTRLGPYDIKALIGEGGMGEVYRATDTRLKRDVAIKVLPQSFASDPDRLARFEREAQVLASLNHPHIAQIHGLEESNGTRALVMELVEGPTLADRIAQGPLHLDEALPIARQISEALEAAHEAGIVHRDLKPANIKLRPDGTVKVLDFGLAKAMESATPAAGLANSPTFTSPAMMTHAGVILGTAPYMSPEQARGKRVDKRTDIWAFGTVLFEMLTSRRAFVGEDVTETLAAVVRDEPDWSLLPREVSPTLLAFLRQTLQKDPRHRVGDIHDVRLALEGAFDTDLRATSPVTSPGSRLAWGFAAFAMLAMGAMLVPTVRHLRQPPTPETRLELVTPATPSPEFFALSPDGRQIAFVASGDGSPRLWLRSLSATSMQPLAGTEGASYPFWAPDGRSLAFYADGYLKQVDLDGGAPRSLAPAQAGRGGAWNADGTILFSPTTISPLLRISAAGGEASPLTTTEERQISHRFPVFLPDGRQFLFFASGEPDVSGIYLSSLDDVRTVRLTLADTAGAFLPAGWLLWVRGSTLVAQRLDVSQRTLTGDAVVLADSVSVNGSYFGGFSVSPSGLIAYRTLGTPSRRQLTWFDRSGKTLGTMGAPDHTISGPSVSPNGRRVAVSRTVQGNTDLWVVDGTRTTRLTFDPGRDDNPIWSPDGRRIVFASLRKGPYEMYIKEASGGSEEERFLDWPLNATPKDWSTDGRFVVYVSRHPQSDNDLWVRPTQGHPTPWTFLKTSFSEEAARFSPDGRSVAYMSNESGRTEVYIRPFEQRSEGAAKSLEGQRQVSTNGGMFPTWRSDGKELYYIAPDGTLMAAPIALQGTANEPGTPASLFPTRLPRTGSAGGTEAREYDVTGDGHFLINTVIADAVAAPITVIQNWREQ